MHVVVIDFIGIAFSGKPTLCEIGFDSAHCYDLFKLVAPLRFQRRFFSAKSGIAGWKHSDHDLAAVLLKIIDELSIFADAKLGLASFPVSIETGVTAAVLPDEVV